MLILFALLFAAALGVRFLLTWRSQHQLVDEFSADLRNVIKVVHFATQRMSLSEERDKEALGRFVSEAVARHKALREISVVNIHQEIVASSNPAKVGKRLSETWRESIVEGEMHEEDTLDWYEVAIPIVREQKVIGQVSASILLGDATESLNKLFTDNVVVSLILFVAVSLASYMAIRKMSLPLQHLVAAARRVGSGDLSAKVPGTGRDEHAEVAIAFNAMIEKLQEQKQIEDRLHEMERRALLSETAATLAHEIRNPLNLINLTAGHLGRQFVPDAEKQRENYLKLVESLKVQVKHLNDMVNDFLAVGRPMKLQKGMVALAELVGQIEMLLKQHMVLKQAKLVCEFPPELRLWADQEQMRLVLLNLILNAIEVSPRGGNVVVSARESAGTVTIRVSDSGPGIQPDDLNRVFEPYYTKRPGGTGLGLTLARRIVEEHGGRIAATNNPDRGASLAVSLPAKEA